MGAVAISIVAITVDRKALSRNCTAFELNVLSVDSLARSVSLLLYLKISSTDVQVMVLNKNTDRFGEQ